MKHTIFKGAAVALITPFNADGSINYEDLVFAMNARKFMEGE